MKVTEQGEHEPAQKRLAIGRALIFCRLVNGILMILLIGSFLLGPAFVVINDLRDARIRRGGIPLAAWKQHRALSPRYARWAEHRLTSNRGLELSTENISGTEWPLFGSVFYLWATEALQEDWDPQQPVFSSPKIYAKDAIEAAAALVIDPKQAGWVKQHYGTNYLTQEDTFYRMLVISALTSHARLTDDKSYLEMLRGQVESLSAEIAASPHGLLEDYPGECYPGDVLTAIAMIRKADRVLGTDHAGFCAQAIRGFQGPRMDNLGLVPYAGDSKNGLAVGPSRGCGNSYVSLFSPGIWPEQAKKWYGLYEQNFWQEGKVMVGFREFPKQMHDKDWYADVDSGPVIGGIGFAASAFGVGAARVNGRFDHAYPLTAEMYATSWPLPNRTLLLPRLLSNAIDAPYLGEAAVLYVLTRSPMKNFPVKTGGSIPALVIIIIAFQLVMGLALVGRCIFSLRRWMKTQAKMIALSQRTQFTIWLVLLASAFVFLLFGHKVVGMLLLLLTQFFPRCRISKCPT